jgi:hypothetical protein
MFAPNFCACTSARPANSWPEIPSGGTVVDAVALELR